MAITDKIDFKQPKYVLPLIIYLPMLVTGYFIFDLFGTSVGETEDKKLETTEYLNSNLPEAQIKDDGIGNRYENMLKSFGRIQDYSAVEGIDREENEQEKEKYASKYSAEDLALLDADVADKAQELERLRDMEARIRSGKAKGEGMAGGEADGVPTEDERLARSRKRQDEALAELNKALDEARNKGRKGLGNLPADTARSRKGVSTEKRERAVEGSINSDSHAVRNIDEKAPAQEVVKKLIQPSDYFNTIAENAPEPNLIKAIIDENIKAVDGSRVRLRLLDDVLIGDCHLGKGAYLYATVSGFSSQRVKGKVESVLVDDELVKVNLSIYDTDGLEGLYVPSSKFRETAKDVASGAVGGSMSLNTSGSSDNMLQQWGMQALNNAYQKTANALSSSMKKNRAKLKYGSFVYLVNGREKRK